MSKRIPVVIDKISIEVHPNAIVVKSSEHVCKIGSLDITFKHEPLEGFRAAISAGPGFGPSAFGSLETSLRDITFKHVGNLLSFPVPPTPLPPPPPERPLSFSERVVKWLRDRNIVSNKEETNAR